MSERKNKGWYFSLSSGWIRTTLPTEGEFERANGLERDRFSDEDEQPTHIPETARKVWEARRAQP